MTNSENDLKAQREPEQRQLYQIAKVNEFLEILLGYHNLCAAQTEYHSLIKQMTAIGYISTTEEIVTASWALSQHDGVAAFKLSEK